jgi:endonuclease G
VLFITCGPAGVGGEGSDGKKKEIGKGKIDVTVPAKVWKTILVLPNEKAEPTKQTRVIAVIFPNDQSVDYDWAKYRVSVAEVEKLSGCKFWPAIPEDTARALKTTVDEVKVNTPRP